MCHVADFYLFLLIDHSRYNINSWNRTQLKTAKKDNIIFKWMKFTFFDLKKRFKNI